MLLHCRVTPSSILLVPIYTLGWRETNWIKVPCVRKEPDGWDLNPEPPDLECEALTAQPLMPPPKKNKFCLHQFSLQEIFFPEITLACVQMITKLWLVPSAKQRRDLCSGPPTDSTNYRKCVSNSPSTWLAITTNKTKAFFNWPIVARTGAYSNLGTQLEVQNKDFGAVSQTELTRV